MMVTLGKRMESLQKARPMRAYTDGINFYK